jgi:formate hydrogenlyase subunit 6/NADH:ubiquinone oxidoreductase subunit I
VRIKTLMTRLETADCWLLSKERFDDLLGLLAADGFEVIGPRLDQGAIVYGPVTSARDLPVGWTDVQQAGSYRLQRRADDAWFGFAVGPHSWKKYLFPPELRLWQARRTADGCTARAVEPETPPRAFLGMRSCELHALAVQDRAFMGRGPAFADRHYSRARRRLFLIAVECEHPGGTCFCDSMGTGPAVRTERIPLATLPAEGGSTAGPAGELAPVDLVLTELEEAFVVRAASQAGRDVVSQLSLPPAADDQLLDARRRVQQAAGAMGRAVDVRDVRGLLHGNQEHPRWDDVAGRCLACTNCTLVCPTCFCFSVHDVTDLSADHAERVRTWDSCFDPDFARVHGGNYRPTVRGRYRQWLTHKFASWYDQFGVSGCVGCGRCITWCPVGIDVTEEITAIRAADQRPGDGAP